MTTKTTTTFSLSHLDGPPQSKEDRRANPPFEVLIRRFEAIAANPSLQSITALTEASTTAELGAFDSLSCHTRQSKSSIIERVTSGVKAEIPGDAGSYWRLVLLFEGVEKDLFELGCDQWRYDHARQEIPELVEASIRTLRQRPAASAGRRPL